MTETAELEQELESLLIGKVVQIKYTHFSKEERVEIDTVNRLAVDIDTRPNHYLILFTNQGKRLEINLDDFSTHIKVLN